MTEYNTLVKSLILNERVCYPMTESDKLSKNLSVITQIKVRQFFVPAVWGQ